MGSLHPFNGLGVGLRREHYAHVLAHLPRVSWFEIITENFLGLRGAERGGRPRKILEKVRHNYPVALHGVSLSLGSVDPLSQDYLRRLGSLAREIDPLWISDHLCWTGVGGENLHDLLPLPYTEEALEHVVGRLLQVQDVLGRRILIENVSSYLSYAHSQMSEWEFLSEVSRRADCGILLDLNNVYVSAVNHGFDPFSYIESLPAERIGQIHLAGHSTQGRLLIDSHDHPVPPAVWDLYRQSVARFGPISASLEWDSSVPEFEVLEAELSIARKNLEEVSASSSESSGNSVLDALGSHRSSWGRGSSGESDSVGNRGPTLA